MKAGFAKRLKEAREAAGYPSAAQFAYAIGLEPPAYRRYERGEVMPSVEDLQAMTDLLGVTIDSLLPKKNALAA